MKKGEDDEISSILESIKKGEEEAKHKLFALVYEELKKLAKNRICNNKCGSMGATSLVHETFAKMAGEKSTWDNKHYFFGAASRAMRNILVDRARHDSAKKRGGEMNQVEFHENLIPISNGKQLIKLDEALEKFESIHPVAGEIVNLKFFAGLASGDIANMIGVSVSTVGREWKFAKAWLSKEIKDS